MRGKPENRITLKILRIRAMNYRTFGSGVAAGVWNLRHARLSFSHALPPFCCAFAIAHAGFCWYDWAHLSYKNNYCSPKVFECFRQYF